MKFFILPFLIFLTTYYIWNGPELFLMAENHAEMSQIVKQSCQNSCKSFSFALLKREHLIHINLQCYVIHASIVFCLVFQSANAQQKEQLELLAAIVTSDNIELACSFIQKSAVEKCLIEIDKRLVSVRVVSFDKITSEKL